MKYYLQKESNVLQYKLHDRKVVLSKEREIYGRIICIPKLYLMP